MDESVTVQGSRARLDSAARGGMENLRSAWGSIPADHKQVIGPQGCPDEFKQIAQSADATRPPSYRALAAVPPASPLVLQPFHSVPPTSPNPLVLSPPFPLSSPPSSLFSLSFPLLF